MKIVESLNCQGFILWRAALNMINLLIMFKDAEVETVSRCSVSLSPVSSHEHLQTELDQHEGGSGSGPAAQGARLMLRVGMISQSVRLPLQVLMLR